MKKETGEKHHGLPWDLKKKNLTKGSSGKIQKTKGGGGPMGGRPPTRRPDGRVVNGNFKSTTHQNKGERGGVERGGPRIRPKKDVGAGQSTEQNEGLSDECKGKTNE